MMSDKRIEIVELSQEDLDAVAEIEKETFSLPWSRQSFADAIEDSFAAPDRAEILTLCDRYFTDFNELMSEENER